LLSRVERHPAADLLSLALPELNSMYWQPDLETMPRVALHALQLQRLQETVTRLAVLVPFYRDHFAKSGVTPEDKPGALHIVASAFPPPI
jgi:phenylacetate-CoA ligase